MNNPDLLFELAQLHRHDLLREAAQEQAAHAMQRHHADRSGHAVSSFRALLMGWIATPVTKRSLATAQQDCCTSCAASV